MICRGSHPALYAAMPWKMIVWIGKRLVMKNPREACVHGDRGGRARKTLGVEETRVESFCGTILKKDQGHILPVHIGLPFFKTG